MRLEIQEMVLRIPGISPQRANQVGQQVALQLARRVEGISAARQLGVLDLKIQAAAGQTPDELTEAIVQAILDQIR